MLVTTTASPTTVRLASTEACSCSTRGPTLTTARIESVCCTHAVAPHHQSDVHPSKVESTVRGTSALVGNPAGHTVKLERETGLEPATSTLATKRSSLNHW